MWMCKSCKEMHSDMRERCPVTGHPKPIKIDHKDQYSVRRLGSRAEEDCGHCTRPVRQETGRGCDTCDGFFHPKCYERHKKACEDRAAESEFQEWLDYINDNQL